MKKRNKIYIASIIILLISIFAGLLLAYIKMNSKFFIKRDFIQAFRYRVTGDCSAFIEYIYQDNDKWNERCKKEKSRENEPIRKFEIQTVTHKFGSDKAFLQAELTRNATNKEDYTYSASYEMKRSDFKWKIMNEIK